MAAHKLQGHYTVIYLQGNFLQEHVGDDYLARSHKWTCCRSTTVFPVYPIERSIIKLNPTPIVPFIWIGLGNRIGFGKQNLLTQMFCQSNTV